MTFKRHTAVTGHEFVQDPCTFTIRILDEEFHALHKYDQSPRWKTLEQQLEDGGLVIAAHFCRTASSGPIVMVAIRPEQVTAETMDMIATILRAHILRCMNEKQRWEERE